MNDEDQVLALFGEANPVSDLDKLEELMSPRLEIVEQRTGDMTETKVREIDPNRPIVKSEWQRGLLYGLAAAVGVLIVGAVTWIALLDDGGSDVASAPVDIGRSFIEARDAWDAETTEALFAPVAVIDDLEVPRLADYAAQYRWYQAVEWRWTADECVEVVPGPPTTVDCSYTMENAWSRALEAGPISGSMEFVVADGRILELTHNGVQGFNLSDFGPVWDAFRDWVFVNHRDNLEVMYVSASNDPSYTSESMALWEQYTNEYVASVTDSATP